MKSGRRHNNHSRRRKIQRPVEPYYQASYREIMHDLKLLEGLAPKKQIAPEEIILPQKRPRPERLVETIEETQALEMLVTLINKTEVPAPKVQAPTQRQFNAQQIEAYQRANLMKLGAYWNQQYLMMMQWQNYYANMNYYGAHIKRIQTEMQQNVFAGRSANNVL
ncbi:unnamed protein product [Blepharisma stoltei]|uniref:Uncharacterized protein n=1 Tax=Blepharisma stoltei TaxID=1481888 RepID=A0AAU9JN20_9CILI|nr:unnamed protein product [Blepharisma stoltei]